MLKRAYRMRTAAALPGATTLLAAAVLLVACAAVPPAAAPPAASPPTTIATAPTTATTTRSTAAPPGSSTRPPSPAPAERSDVGRSVYQSTCARCHETGEHGAPIAGRPADWASRSRLWQAVLADHVQRGWFAMPARGGNDALSDAEVQAAAEYLLARTHRRRPQD